MAFCIAADGYIPSPLTGSLELTIHQSLAGICRESLCVPPEQTDFPGKTGGGEGGRRGKKEEEEEERRKTEEGAAGGGAGVACPMNTTFVLWLLQAYMPPCTHTYSHTRKNTHTHTETASSEHADHVTGCPSCILTEH